MTDLRVTVGEYDLEATWTDDAPETRAAFANALPLSGEAIRWGDELYFDASISVSNENAREVVPEGAIAYWPAGEKCCLFWGPTPASVDDEPRAAAPVTVVAVLEDVAALSGLEGGARVSLDRS
ncbi:hypothetical protein D8Y22_21195 [Salinadaptatus halalkaliphilus]|uniref:Cyclophilin TM1367-like domain-containing protein n=1 Tax=Salinadaptatus halalkaliphilus TaxID=2419781 RepID=A0A4S3TK68_9EURY|nr:cyclophilin-like family protein [Salinadaptatus halalkaliphilus]THE62968.1 hypothetical protein D8Y22_21195 [Salinadaptatus halalkaliphilus]